jgi:hypothetical protein
MLNVKLIKFSLIFHISLVLKMRGKKLCLYKQKYSFPEAICIYFKQTYIRKCVFKIIMYHIIRSFESVMEIMLFGGQKQIITIL